MRLIILAMMLWAMPGLAQTLSPPPQALGSMPAPVDPDSAQAYLMVARQALAARRDQDVNEALEQAESRALTRDVRPSTAGVPSEQSLVKVISGARAALAAGDRTEVLVLIDRALAWRAP